MIKIVDNCCSPRYLDTLYSIVSNAESWHMQYPRLSSIEDRHLKLNIIPTGAPHFTLAGLAVGLLIQIYEAGGRDSFIPDPIVFCGISMKDKHRLDNIHVDHEESEGFVKILGIINSDWEEKWGGGFLHDGTSNYIKPTSFCIFDPSKPHAAAEIFTDKKRLAIDFTVFRDQQSQENFFKKNNLNKSGYK